MVLGVQVAAGGSSLIRLVRRSFTCVGRAHGVPIRPPARANFPTRSRPTSACHPRSTSATSARRRSGSTQRAAESLYQFSTAASGTGCRERQPLLWVPPARLGICRAGQAVV